MDSAPNAQVDVSTAHINSDARIGCGEFSTDGSCLYSSTDADSVGIARFQHFDYDKTMEITSSDPPMSAVAAAIAEPARTRMLYCLMDGRARTSTELAMVAEVSPSTASVHLQRLKMQRLVKVLAQGKHRYYSLEG